MLIHDFTSSGDSAVNTIDVIPPSFHTVWRGGGVVNEEDVFL